MFFIFTLSELIFPKKRCHFSKSFNDLNSLGNCLYKIYSYSSCRNFKVFSTIIKKIQTIIKKNIYGIIIHIIYYIYRLHIHILHYVYYYIINNNMAHSRTITWETKGCGCHHAGVPSLHDASLVLLWCCVVKYGSARVDGVCVPNDHSPPLSISCFWSQKVRRMSLDEVTEVLVIKMVSGQSHQG